MEDEIKFSFKLGDDAIETFNKLILFYIGQDFDWHNVFLRWLSDFNSVLVDRSVHNLSKMSQNWIL